MFHFECNSDYGYFTIGRLSFSWLNKFSHYEDGVTSVTWMGGDVEWSIDLDASGLTLVKMVEGDIVQSRSLITCTLNRR
jgi:hypothetical protein